MGVRMDVYVILFSFFFLHRTNVVRRTTPRESKRWRFFTSRQTAHTNTREQMWTRTTADLFVQARQRWQGARNGEREREKKLKPKQNQKRGREKKGPQRIPLTSRDSCTGAGMHTEGSSEPTIQLKWSLEPAPAPADAYLTRIPKSSDSKMLNRQLVDCMDSVWQDDDLRGKGIPLINAPQCVYQCPKGLLVCLRWRNPNSLTHFTGAQQGARTDVHQLMQGATTAPPRCAPRTNGVYLGREANKYSKHEQRVALYNDEESRLASGETMSPS